MVLTGKDEGVGWKDALFSRVLLMIHCVSIFFRDTEIHSQSRNLLERSQLLLLLHSTLQRDLFVSSMTTFNFFFGFAFNNHQTEL